MTLADIAQGVSALPLEGIEGLASLRVREVVIDSRQVQAGDVFVALAGEHVDGHAFVREAFTRGAIAALVKADQDVPLNGLAAGRLDTTGQRNQADHQTSPQVHAQAVTSPQPSLLILTDDPLAALQRLAAFWRRKAAGPALRVIGITGSIGKTTTKELVAQVLGMRYRTLKSEGNLNNEIGVPLTLLKLRPEHERAVIEMGMYTPGEIAVYCQWALPATGIVTIIAPVHLERLGSIDQIVQAKTELVASLPPASEGGVAILNDDDERVRGMARATQARILTYGLSARADVWADNIASSGLDGIAFTLHYKDQSRFVKLALLGQHSVQTALRATAAGLAEGLALDEIVEGLAIHSAQLRLVVARGPHGSLVLDDTYNASAESTLAALNLLNEIEDEGPRIAVLGDMLELGDTEKEAHDEVGCRAALVAQAIIGVGERSRWTCQAAVECGAARDRVFHVMTNAEALEVLGEIVGEKCVILVKGSRGMQMEMIVAGLGELAGED